MINEMKVAVKGALPDSPVLNGLQISDGYPIPVVRDMFDGGGEIITAVVEFVAAHSETHYDDKPDRVVLRIHAVEVVADDDSKILSTLLLEARNQRMGVQTLPI